MEQKEKKKLFLPTPEGVDLYPYFESVIYAGRYPTPLSSFDTSEEMTYCLSLPISLVSPRIYRHPSRLAVALGIDSSSFVALCRGTYAIAPRDVCDFEAPTAMFRDDTILRSASGAGYRGVSALRYLCEHYLEGLSLREDAVISAVRVDRATALALLDGYDLFLEDRLRMAYAQVFTRAARIARVAVLGAPEMILRNEVMLLHCALERLSETSPFDID